MRGRISALKAAGEPPILLYTYQLNQLVNTVFACLAIMQ